MKSQNVRNLWCAVAALTVSFFSTIPAHAQWSADPTVNLVVSDIANGSTQPKIVPAPDGGFYVSWFDNIAAGFDIHLQRLDVAGNELWAHDGILVADRSYSFTYDYGLSADSAGNAYVSFNCCENGAGDEHIAVSKVTPDGTLAWGAAGITVSTVVEAIYNAYVAPTTDGNVVVAWSSDGGVRAQKLDTDGNALWAAGGVLLDQPAGLKLLGGIQPADLGNAIVSWSNQSGSTRILRAQKLASLDGAALWGAGTALQVFGTGNLQAGYYPPFLSDGSGGGVFWDYDAVGVSFVPRVQHIDTNGTLLLGVNGVVATNDTNDHTDTSATYDPATGDIYVVWRDTFTNGGGQSFDGVSAQRVDASGALLWGAAGKVLVPLTDSTNGTNSISQPIALPMPDGFLASWVTGAIPADSQPLTVTRLDAAGNAVWPAQTVVIKTARYTARAEGAVSTTGYAAYAWQDGDDGAGLSTIRAQNINLDGTLGSSGPAIYSVSVEISGLLGAGLALQLNGGSDMAVLGDGGYTFSTLLADGDNYAVTVFSNPTGPDQTCTVENGTGTIAGADVTGIPVTCVTNGPPDLIFADGFEIP
jgi:hypothetical protein